MMNIKSILFVALSTLVTNVAWAAGCETNCGSEGPPPVSLPLDDAGMLAVAGACLVVAIRIAQRKRSR